MEKTYFDFRVTFIHVVVFLVAVIAIGIFLFYMGYQAGHRLAAQPAGIETTDKEGEAGLDTQEKIDMVDEQPVQPAKQSIPAEMQLHEKQAPEGPPPTAGKNAFADQNYGIQVDAFADFTNAQKYSEKFARLGYQTEIIVETVKGKKLHTVRVGSFASLQEAQKEKNKLEGLEKKKFIIKKGH